MPVRSARDGRVTSITLDSPGNRNALSPGLLAELGGAIEQAVGDASRVIVLTHEGPVFSAGLDLKSPIDLHALIGILEALMTAPKPVIARVLGDARAGGVGIMAACDLVVCRPASSFAVSEVRIGAVPAVISAIVVPRVGVTRALELFLTGAPVDAESARSAGLVTAVAEDVDAVVAGYVEHLCKGAPEALAATKRLLRPPVDWEALQRLSAEVFAGDEAKEGFRAFVEKREPAWVR